MKTIVTPKVSAVKQVNPTADKITVVHEYHTAYNAVVEPDKYVPCTRYFLRRWMPLLGGIGTQIVLTLRSLGYYNPTTGEKRDGIEIDLPALAELVGLHPATIKREFGWKIVKGEPQVGTLQNPTLHVFVSREKQYRNDPVTGQVLRAQNIYRVKMDDPLHDVDLPKLQEALDAQEKGNQKAQVAPNGETVPASRKAQVAPKKKEVVSDAVQVAQNEAQVVDQKAQVAPTLKDYSYPPKKTKTTLNTKEQEAQKIERAENTENTDGLAPEAPAVPVVIVKTGWDALTEAERLPYLSEADLLLKGKNPLYANMRHPERLLIPQAKAQYDAKQKRGA